MIRLITLISFFFCIEHTISQRHAIYISQRVGLSTERFESDAMLRAKNDIGISLGYQFEVISNTNLWLYSAFEFARSRHEFIFSENIFSQNIYENTLHVEVIDVLTKRNAIHLGLRKSFSILENKIELGLGLGLVKRFYPSKEQVYYQYLDLRDEKNTEFEILFTTLHDGRHTDEGFVSNNRIFNMESEVFVQFNLSEKCGIRFNVAYSRNNYIYYLNKFRRTTDLGNGTKTMTYYNGDVGENGSKKYSRNHFLYLGFTLNYVF